METNQDSYPWGLKAAVPLQFLKNTVAKVGLMQIDFTNVAPHGILVLIFCPSALDSTCTPWPFTETVLSHHHTFCSLLQEILAGIHLCNFVFTDISKNIETAFYLPKHTHPTQRIPRLFPHTLVQVELRQRATESHLNIPHKFGFFKGEYTFSPTS